MKKYENLVQYTCLCLVVVMRLASTPTANLSYMVLAAYALLGRAQAIQALFMSWLFTMLNPGIGAQATQATVGRYLVIFGAVTAVVLRSEAILRFRKPVAVTLGLGFFLVLHSLAVSPAPDVSILKAVSWMLVMSALLSAWLGLSEPAREKLIGQIFAGLVAIVVLSLPLLGHPLGYLRNGTGFQGILNHPQPFGMTVAILGAWSACQLLATRRPPWLSIGLFGLCVVLILFSEARTAGLSLVLAILVAVIVAPAVSGQRRKAVFPGLRSMRLWSVLFVVLGCGIVFSQNLSEGVYHYISKSGRSENVSGLMEAYDRSRGGLIDQMWRNIKAHPLLGIGFGVASNPHEMAIKRDPLLGLPVGASVEKGVLPVAVVEELGLTGLVIVGLYLWMLFRRSSQGGIAAFTVVAVIFLLNMGENTFFSPGGMGLLVLILLAWALASASNSGRPAIARITGKLAIAPAKRPVTSS
ncbi:MAG: O-antigen ligase family protein [Parahaliea sp.]